MRWNKRTLGAETTIVPLQSSGSKPPLIVGHGVGGFLFRYSHLVRRLDPEQPVYGLCPTDALVASKRRLRIEDLARQYVGDIVRLQPTGPLCLAGFCFGGVLMIEVAHQLEEIGRDVAVVVLFDAEPPSAPPASKARREVDQLVEVRARSRVSGNLCAASSHERQDQGSPSAVARESLDPCAHRAATVRALGRRRPGAGSARLPGPPNAQPRAGNVRRPPDEVPDCDVPGR